MQTSEFLYKGQIMLITKPDKYCAKKKATKTIPLINNYTKILRRIFIIDPTVHLR